LTFLQEGERNYLDTLGLGLPLLIQECFYITEDGSARPQKAVCMLFNDILLLCRYQAESSLTSWDQTPASSRLVTTTPETEKLFVYGYLYPRHIDSVKSTAVGITNLIMR
jgi:hypothetical protein